MNRFLTMLKVEVKLSFRGMDMVIFAICAGGIMGLPLVVSDYRHKKILKRFQVTPSSPTLLLAVQLTIYMIYSLIALILIYLTSYFLFKIRLQGSFFPFIFSFFLVMLSMFSIGMLVGGLSPNIKIASILASVLYFPMLILSGATLPYEIMPDILKKAANFLPLTQGIKLLKATSLGLPVENIIVPLIVMVTITIICGGLAIRFFQWE